jgi:hypothetical protein
MKTFQWRNTWPYFGNENPSCAIQDAVLHSHFDIALYLLEKFPDFEPFDCWILGKVTIEVLEFLNLHSLPWTSSLVLLCVMVTQRW